MIQIECEPGNDWRGLQDRVSQILNECGLTAQVGVNIQTARGQVEIDVYATDPTTSPSAIYLCECKRWTTCVPQAEVQTFRTIANDIGTHFGLFISSAGFQTGAFDVVKHTNIHLLDWCGFQQLFIERRCNNYWIPTFRKRADRLAGRVEPICSDAPRREANGESLEAYEAIGLMALGMYDPKYTGIFNNVLKLHDDNIAEDIWLLRNKYKQYLPVEVAEAQDLRTFLDTLVAFSDRWVKENIKSSKG